MKEWIEPMTANARGLDYFDRFRVFHDVPMFPYGQFYGYIFAYLLFLLLHTFTIKANLFLIKYQKRYTFYVYCLFCFV